jgi:hypothetical protein
MESMETSCGVLVDSMDFGWTMISFGEIYLVGV